MMIYVASDFTSVPGAFPVTWTVAFVTWLSTSQDVLRSNARLAKTMRLGICQGDGRVHARRAHTQTSISWDNYSGARAHERACEARRTDRGNG